MAAGSVLLVEDDEILARILVHHLEAHGFGVDRVDSAEAATTALQGPRVQPRLVLLDVNLPGDSGWSLFRNGVLGRDGDPAVVVMTAVPVSPSRIKEFRIAGYLPKPFPMEVLMECVERLAGGEETDA